jgi:hypothetical protein
MLPRRIGSGVDTAAAACGFEFWFRRWEREGKGRYDGLGRGKWAVIPEKAAQYPLVTTAREVGPARSSGQFALARSSF